MHKLDDEKAKMVRENFKDWWDKYIFRNKQGEISETEFVSALKKDYESDKEKFQKEMDACFDTFFDVIDTNKDRSISEDEFLIAFKAYGHENVAKDTNFFQSYKPVEGLVPLRTVVNSWIDFVCNNDASQSSIVKSAFEASSKK